MQDYNPLKVVNHAAIQTAIGELKTMLQAFSAQSFRIKGNVCEVSASYQRCTLMHAWESCMQVRKLVAWCMVHGELFFTMHSHAQLKSEMATLFCQSLRQEPCDANGGYKFVFLPTCLTSKPCICSVPRK